MEGEKEVNPNCREISRGTWYKGYISLGEDVFLSVCLFCFCFFFSLKEGEYL